MTTKDTALRLALEALEPVSTYGRAGSRDTDTAKAQQAITAIREALAQPAGERGGFIDRSDAVNLARNMMEIHDCKGITEKGVRVLCDAVLRMDAALLSSDAQPSSWVGLSDEETAEAWFVAGGMHSASTVVKRRIAHAIEAKLRKKNARKDMPAAADNEADDLLRRLGLDPEQYRTDGGYINHLKVKAAIRNPWDYPQLNQCEHQFVHSAGLGGRLCKLCGSPERMGSKPAAEYKAGVDEPVAWMREGWGPDCGPYVEFYRDDEMGWRDRKEWTPLFTRPQPQEKK